LHPRRSDEGDCRSTGSQVDVDHHLDMRQMRRERSAVHAALGGSCGPLGQIGCVNFGFAARSDLLHLFQTVQHLIFRQRLRAPAEAMTLELFDDLTESVVLCRSAISIAFNVPRSSGSESVVTVMTD
jgi:hypothetical protein